MIFCTVYVSVAAEPWDQVDLTALLAQSRTANAAVDVTGLLLYRDDVFMQVLEGEEEVVRALYRRIAADPRHHDVANIWVAYAPQRRFPDWSMGFRHLEHDELALEGHRDLLALESAARRGLDPDVPFPGGEVNRVVRGVRIHPLPAPSAEGLPA
ncbi:MAG: hypothetical protein EOP01_08190 [Propionibacteriaceae bacterium]|nr:MAG: hypothetical protein EOP01_08190 [Propionibacteriaceae bacterium]